MKKHDYDLFIKRSVYVILFLLSLITLIYFLYLLAFVYRNNEYGDFVNYYMSAKIILSGMGDKMFDVTFQTNGLTNILGVEPTGSVLLFRALPVTAILFFPSALFGLESAYRFYLLINFLICFLIGSYFNRQLKTKITGYLLVFGFLFIISVLKHNQLAGFFLLFYFLIYHALKKDKFFLAGTITGFLALKINIFVTFFGTLFLFAEKKFKYAAGALLSLLIIFLISGFITTGFEFPLDYLHFITSTENLKFGSFSINYFSLTPIYWLLFDAKTESLAVMILNYVLFLISALFLKKSLIKLPIKFAGPLSVENTLSLGILFSFLFGFHIISYEISAFIFLLFFYFKKHHKTNQEDGVFYIVLLFLSLGAVFVGFFQGLPTILKPLFIIFWLMFFLSGYNLDLFRNSLKKYGKK